jgi:predicted NUDIX family phosphoesterase
MDTSEKVLVVERKVLERVGLFQGVNYDVARYVNDLWKGTGVCFIPRIEAENDPSYKQLIPYVVMTHGGKYLCYVRGKGVDEARLAQKVSIGIGGHINPCDATDMENWSIKEVYDNAVVREVGEEVLVGASHDDRIVALINDDSNEVGQVHLGIVHLWRLAAPRVEKREEDILELRFMSVHELHLIEDRMESWSKLLLADLGAIAKIGVA